MNTELDMLTVQYLKQLKALPHSNIII